MTPIEKKRLLRCIYAILLLAVISAGALIIMKHFGGFIPCPFLKLTGFRCPGCGNTRAFAALIHLHFAESLKYNYAYPAEYLFLLIVLIRSAKNYVKNGKASYYPKHPGLVYAFLAALLFWGVLRNFLGV